ncbi:maleylpyruvate isomerase family mycothiol-dependent enzyme [Streptomyces rimosus]|uniref:maleylpyruvate isomerase family mycothiol-dependent enzyme n=1 Tax=Streptomyces rimosus TaxID=1927 RepID=UPI0004CBA46D|nr:maleylpyruvate isomerase family mycothiol-dependent enzyme [Streptomyces rimosus]
MTLLAHDLYCRHLLAETDEFAATLADADPSATVPTCPDWSLRDLVVHLGRAQRWYEANVRARAAEPLPFVQEGPAGDAGPAALGAWLTEGASRLAETLQEAGPDQEMWAWGESHRTGFWARRAVHETLVHRADAAAATKRGFTADPWVAADAVDEWLEMLSSPHARTRKPRLAELRGPGRSIHLHATDAVAGLNGEWVVEFGEDGFTWRRGHAKATVALRGPVVDVLRVFYRRLPADSDRVEVLGDARLLDFWLERTSF